MSQEKPTSQLHLLPTQAGATSSDRAFRLCRGDIFILSAESVFAPRLLRSPAGSRDAVCRSLRSQQVCARPPVVEGAPCPVLPPSSTGPPAGDSATAPRRTLRKASSACTEPLLKKEEPTQVSGKDGEGSERERGLGRGRGAELADQLTGAAVRTVHGCVSLNGLSLLPAWRSPVLGFPWPVTQDFPQRTGRFHRLFKKGELTSESLHSASQGAWLPSEARGPRRCQAAGGPSSLPATGDPLPPAALTGFLVHPWASLLLHRPFLWILKARNYLLLPQDSTPAVGWGACASGSAAARDLLGSDPTRWLGGGASGRNVRARQVFTALRPSGLVMMNARKSRIN